MKQLSVAFDDPRVRVLLVVLLMLLLVGAAFVRFIWRTALPS